jgi:hypothetical protein
MVNEQWKHGQNMARGCGSYMLPDGAKVGHEPAAQYLRALCPEYRCPALGVQSDAGAMFCGVFLAPPGSLCRRVNTLQSLLDVNREFTSVDDAGKLVTLVDASVLSSMHWWYCLTGSPSPVAPSGISCAQEWLHAGQPKGFIKELVHPTAEISARAIVASGCIVGEQSVIEDKTSVKRSVIGPRCKYGVTCVVLQFACTEGAASCSALNR